MKHDSVAGTTRLPWQYWAELLASFMDQAVCASSGNPGMAGGEPWNMTEEAYRGELQQSL